MPDLTILLIGEPALTIAYVVFGMVGFGTTLVAAPILAHVLALSTVVPALALTDFVAAWTNGFRLGAHVVGEEVFRLVPPMLVGSALGAWALFASPGRTLMLLLGIFVVLYALNGLRPRHARPPLAPRWAWWFGTAGGVLSALFGAGGWVYSIYLLRRLDDPQQIRATQMAVLTVSSTIRVALFALAGTYFDRALLLLVLAFLPAMVLGLAIGHRIALRLDRKRFLQLLYGVLLVTGSSLVLRAL
jgi:uncharacterized membrane protein YfcA